MNLLFVYGTLKRGFSNAGYLRDAIYLGEYVTPECYSMYDFGNYPAVCESGDSAIYGEVYQITPQLLEETDRLEWYPEFYQRTVIETVYGSAWMYLVDRALCFRQTRVSGLWLDSLTE